MRVIAVLSLALVCCATPRAAVGQDTDADAGAGCFSCTHLVVKPIGQLPSVLNELSGLVASRSQKGVLFAFHNDSGDSARFFALSAADAGLLGEFDLPQASAIDWEDIALGPCPAGTCVFLGDIGDNKRVRSDYAVYRVTEPTVTADGTPRSVPFERFAYQYPNGEKHNAEALLVHPVSGAVYLVTKEPVGSVSQVYRFPEPMRGGETATLVEVADLTVPTPTDSPLTAAAGDACGRVVFLRMYNRLVELKLPEAESSFEQIFAQAPLEIPVSNEPQGEAVAFAADGRSYFTASEEPVGPVPLIQYVCE